MKYIEEFIMKKLIYKNEGNNKNNIINNNKIENENLNKIEVNKNDIFGKINQLKIIIKMKKKNLFLKIIIVKIVKIIKPI